jgi:hypothetical protein
MEPDPLRAADQQWLPATGAGAHAPPMFVVSEADAAAIRAVYEQSGELSAAIELRRRWHHRQRTGAGVRPDHRRLEAAAASEANA